MAVKQTGAIVEMGCSHMDGQTDRRIGQTDGQTDRQMEGQME